MNYAVALAALGEAQVDQGLATDAFDTLMRAMTLFGKLQPNPSPDRADVLVSLSRAQITMGRSDGAVASAAQAAAFWQSFDSTGRSSGVASLWRARALHAAGRRDEAAESLRKASGILTSAGYNGRARAAQANAARPASGTGAGASLNFERRTRTHVDLPDVVALSAALATRRTTARKSG